jgi:hypothetical protein
MTLLIERAKTVYASDRAATVIDQWCLLVRLMVWFDAFHLKIFLLVFGLHMYFHILLVEALCYKKDGRGFESR